MPNELVNSSGTKRPSFWDTKEGTTGTFVGFGLLALGGFGLYHILPFIITLLQNTLEALCLGGVVLAIIAVILEGTLPKRLWLVYKRLMWSLTYSIVAYDPAWLARDRQKAAKQKLEVASQARAKLREEQKLIDSTIAGFQKDADDMQKKANYLQTHGGSLSEVRSYASRLQEAMSAVDELTPGAAQIKQLDLRLGEVLDTLKEINENLDYKITAQIRKYNATKAMGNVLSGLRSAFSGSDDVEGLRDQAMSFMSEESDRQFGQIDSFLGDVDKFMSGRRLESAIKADDGMKFLEDLNSRTLQLKVQPARELEPLTYNVEQDATGATKSYWTGKK
jgi:hypothetical protein